MSIKDTIWRFQCDPKEGDPDPVVEIFLKQNVTVDGVEFEQRSTEAVPLRFSELTEGLADLVVPTKAVVKQADIQAIKDAHVEFTPGEIADITP